MQGDEVDRLQTELVEVLEKIESLKSRLASGDSGGDKPEEANHTVVQQTDGVTLGVLVRKEGNLRRKLTLCEQGAIKPAHCEHCGQPIDPKRLEIIPETTLCVACKREEEGIRRLAFAK